MGRHWNQPTEAGQEREAAFAENLQTVFLPRLSQMESAHPKISMSTSKGSFSVRAKKVGQVSREQVDPKKATRYDPITRKMLKDKYNRSDSQDSLWDKEWVESIYSSTFFFLNVAETFDKVWHDSLICKIKKMLPVQFRAILESFLLGCKFRVKYKCLTSRDYNIPTKVP